MKVYVIVDEYRSYETTDYDVDYEIFMDLESAKTYLKYLKEACLEDYRDIFDVESVQELIDEHFEEYEEDDEQLFFEIYDDMMKFIYIEEKDVMSF